MLNRIVPKQTLVAILALAPAALADPPGPPVPAARVFEDWRLECAVGPCEVATRVAGAGGRLVLRLALVDGKAPVLVISTPLPLYLPAGLTLSLSGEEPLTLPWRTCRYGACEAETPLADPLLASLRRERGGTVAFTLVNGVEVRLRFSLMGFTAALRTRDAGGARAP